MHIPEALRAGIFADAAMHTPHEVTLAALDLAERIKADCTVRFTCPSNLSQPYLCLTNAHLNR